MNPTQISGSAEIARLLMEMNELGQFPISILTNQQGFSIASAADPNQDPEKQSAVVALVQRTAAQASSQLGMAATDEISLFDEEGRRLVCRPFEANGHKLILALIVPVKNTSYRRLTNRTIKILRNSWKL